MNHTHKKLKGLRMPKKAKWLGVNHDVVYTLRISSLIVKILQRPRGEVAAYSLVIIRQVKALQKNFSLVRGTYVAWAPKW